MRYAVISDIHSNLEALTRVLREINRKQVDEIVCLGDVVGYGANPDEVVELVRSEVRHIVRGNHDDALHDDRTFFMINSYAKAAIVYSRKLLSVENYEWLKKIPMTQTIDGMMMVHASPSEPRDWKYVFTDVDAQTELSSFRENICLFGHTHVPTIFKESSAHGSPVRKMINVGSVGQPRDGDNRASFGIIDTGDFTYENFRVEYDYELAANKIIAAGLPQFLAERLYMGK